MNIEGNGENRIINEPLQVLYVTGMGHNVKINSQVQMVNVAGMNHRIDGTDPNCLIQTISVAGMNNDIVLNENCANVQRQTGGMNNTIRTNGNTNNNNNYMNYNMNNFGQNSFNDFNSAMDLLNNFGMNFNMNWNSGWNYNMNNQNQMNNNMNNNMDSRNFNMGGSENMTAHNSNNNLRSSMAYNTKDIKNSINKSVNVDSLSDFDKKKLDLILEMDEYQYKHITKYDSFKETECAICMGEFLGNDIIKSFYKCNHIFHKKCLLDWLKKNNTCPLCNHDLSKDIK